RRRSRRRVPSVAIAGYTNAGKSTLLNALTGAGVLVDDSLFATLDPAVRRARTPSGRWFTLTDTVGFVRHLPHQLVEAFRSTLEEGAEADLILHVVDGSDADPRAQISAVREVLGQIGAAKVPEIIVVNKADAADPLEIKGLRLAERGAVVVSARNGAGLPDLLAAIEAALPERDTEVRALVPYGRGDLVARAHEEGGGLAGGAWGGGPPARRGGAAGRGRAVGGRQPGPRRKREFGRFAAIRPRPLMNPGEPSSGSACTRILRCNTVTEPILLVAAS